MFDIDRFKGVNDSFGHLAGDHVLKHLASVIKTRIRREDVLARYGGEEFAIVLPEIDHYNAMQFAEKIRKLVEVAEFKFEDAVIPVTVSIGVASLRGEIEDALEFIKQADTHLFAAKEGGPQSGGGLMVDRRRARRRRRGERRRDSARELREKKRVLAALVVHDLRSPLSAVQGYLELLRDELGRGDRRRRPRSRTSTTPSTLVGKALGLVATILDVDELEDGILRAQLAAGEARRAGRARARRQPRALRGAPAALDVDVDPEHGRAARSRSVRARDREPARQRDPLRAARRTLRDRGASATTGGVEIAIGNNGPPVPDAERDAIFGRYFQVERAPRVGAREPRPRPVLLQARGRGARVNPIADARVVQTRRATTYPPVPRLSTWG